MPSASLSPGCVYPSLAAGTPEPPSPANVPAMLHVLHARVSTQQRRRLALGVPESARPKWDFRFAERKPLLSARLQQHAHCANDQCPIPQGHKQAECNALVWPRLLLALRQTATRTQRGHAPDAPGLTMHVAPGRCCCLLRSEDPAMFLLAQSTMPRQFGLSQANADAIQVAAPAPVGSCSRVSGVGAVDSRGSDLGRSDGCAGATQCGAAVLLCCCAWVAWGRRRSIPRPPAAVPPWRDGSPLRLHAGQASRAGGVTWCGWCARAPGHTSRASARASVLALLSMAASCSTTAHGTGTACGNRPTWAARKAHGAARY